MERDYRCSRCKRGQESGVTRDKLIVKKSVFVTMGAGPRTIRSRVKEWLCPDCVVSDDDWKKENARNSIEVSRLG